MKEFFRTLLSDSSLNMFPDIKQSESTVRLDHPIHIEDERWEVALGEMTTPSEVFNITEENYFFFLTFLDPRLLNTMGMENITEMCSSDIVLINISYPFQLANYVLPEYLAEEMQSSIDNFENGVLKRANAHISVTYDAVSQRMSLSVQKAGQTLISKAIWSNLRVRSNNDRKTYRKRTTHFQV